MGVIVNVFGTGYGIESSGRGMYRWHGHAFNPTSDKTDGYQTWDVFNEAAIGAPVVSTAETNFDLTGFNYGNEVVMQVIRFTSDKADTGEVTLKFKDPDGNYVYTGTGSWSAAGAGNWWWNFAAIGVKAYGAEIHKNGTYTCEYIVTYDAGASSTSGSSTFTVSNYPTAVSGVPEGRIWVEGDYLCFTSYYGYKIRCQHDGTSSYVDTAKAGSVWVESTGKVAYIDASGYKRMTKFGDRFGYDGWTWQIPAAPGATYVGRIWVGWDWEADTYLVLVAEDGNAYRIGAGYVPSGDYQ